MTAIIGTFAVSLGLVAWPAIVSFRVKRWGQALLLIAAGLLAPILGFFCAGIAMQGSNEHPLGVAVYALMWGWIAAVAVPIVIGFLLHRSGRFMPPRPAPKAEWRTPDA